MEFHFRKMDLKKVFRIHSIREAWKLRLMREQF